MVGTRIPMGASCEPIYSGSMAEVGPGWFANACLEIGIAVWCAALYLVSRCCGNGDILRFELQRQDVICATSVSG